MMARRIGLVVLVALIFVELSTVVGASVLSPPPTSLEDRPAGYPGLGNAITVAIWGAVLSSILIGVLLGTWFSLRNTARRWSLLGVVLATIVIAVVWSAAVSAQFPEVSFSYATAGEVARLLQLILTPVTLVVLAPTVWVASRFTRREP